jgi:hypothetical protein
MIMPARDDFQARITRPSAPLITGEVQFWRMLPDDWESALHAVKDVGIDSIATYLSWRRHEPIPGTADLRGVHGPELDVHRFLRLCADLHLTVQLKPGPWICAEEPGGGFPDWVTADDSIIALDHAGRLVSGYNPPFKHPMPSYASARFRDMVRGWISFVWNDLAEFVGPEGPIVATQLDNEPSLGFQDSMYGFDYHPESIDAFRQFVIARHGGLAAVADEWGISLNNIEDLEPPRPGRALLQRALEPRDQDWIRYQRSYIARYLAWLQQINHDCGIEQLADFVNLNTHPIRGVPQSGHTIATALRAAAPIAVVGEDHYFEPPITDHDLTGLAIAAAQGEASGSSLVWAPEVQSGIWRSPGEAVTYPDPTDDELAAWWAAALAVGYQGFNLYMLVDRENWEFAPIARDGRLRPLVGHARALLRATRAIPNLATYRPVPQVALRWNPTELSTAYRVRGTQSAPDTPWDDPLARAAYDAVIAHAIRLTSAGIPFLLSDDRNHPRGLPIVDAATAAEEIAAIAPAVSTSDPGILARTQRSPDSQEVLFIVPWARDAPREDIKLRFTDSRIVALREAISEAYIPVSNGTATLSHLSVGLNLFQIITSPRAGTG